MKLRQPALLLALSGFGWWLSANVVNAQVNTDYKNLILGDTSPIDLAILIINWSLGILALIALIIVLYGGFVWIFSHGEEDKIDHAKTILRNGVIGLSIVLTAWGIVTYVINLLLDVTDANDQYYSPSEPYEPSDGSPFYIDHSNPHDNEDNVPLCHIIAVSFSYPLNETTVTADTFKVTLPYNAITNPKGGKTDGQTCAANSDCLSSLCQDIGDSCIGNQLAGSFDFSESKYAAVFYPATDYESDQTYAVSLSTDIEGIDPNTGAVYNLTAGDSKRNFVFTTGTETDNIPPKVDVAKITPYPNDEAIGICLNPTLQVSFSESLDPASPDDKNFWLYGSIDANADGVDDAPSDSLDIDYIRFSSIGGAADDTISTRPQDQLAKFTRYGINLFSGDPATDNFDGAIYDTCGNPLSGNFDESMTGSPSDDFVDPTSAGISQAFCTCTSGAESCKISSGKSTCSLDSGDDCSISPVVCDSSYKDYVGFKYQWTWTTGDQAYCVPEIDSVTQQDRYYSEDRATTEGVTGTTGAEDTGKVLVTGKYLYPFYDVDFYKNISAAGMNCFDPAFAPLLSCFVGNTNETAITLRTPVASQTGHVTVENGDGADTSAAVAIMDSPYIRNTSPLSGPAGQYVTIKGKNFGDYDPAVEKSQRGHVYFDGVEAEVMCNDGWDDDAIIVRVPDGFSLDNTPNIQVLTTGPDTIVNTTDDKHSNQEAFSITDGEPGPGLCELEPSCSDTGLDDVTAVGENFGGNGTVYFDPPVADYIEGSVKQWNVYNDEFASATVVTNQTPVKDSDVYNFTAANTEGISNGLDFKITCSEPPRVFEYYQCDLDNTFYLPNPRGYSNNACVNSVIYFAFNQNMSDSAVEAGVKVYQCNDDESFDDESCVTEITGSFVSEYLNNAYIGGNGKITMDGTKDTDGDGDADVYDAYSAYTFYPTASLQPKFYYKVVVADTVTNDNNVPMAEPYSWNFQVRDSATNCVADYLSLAPYNQIENNYDATNACLDNYTYNNTSYTFRARPLSAECLVLDDAGDYNWTIQNDTAKSVLGFGDNSATGETVTSQIVDSTTRGYNTVCLQGDEAVNEGEALVTANLLDPNAPGKVAVSDFATVDVDFGYCTQDSDCYTQDCRDTYCDPQTSHCAPDVIGFSPNNASTPDVGPTGCLTLNGCYFGTDQQQPASCMCDSQKQPGQTCAVDVNATTCLLDDRTTTCSLGEKVCTLADTCTEESTAADYTPGFFNGCTCQISVTQTCLVSDGEKTCVAPGNDVCSDTYATHQAGATGAVTLGSQAVKYPAVELCSDTWDNDQVIIKIPNDGSVPANDYAITLSSYYGMGDTFGTEAGDAYNCTVGSDPTPCLCLADPDHGEEGNLINLYGEGFSILTADDNERVTFAGVSTRVASKKATWLVSGQEVQDADIAKGAISADDGVQLQSNNYSSNALDFTVSCSSHLDCGTGCCSAGQCSDAVKCNLCKSDSDCAYGSCQSTCHDGVCAPYITDISPNKGAVGQPVTIQGCYFGSYYDPKSFDPGSQVTVDSIVANLACSEVDSWSNQQIIVTMPDGIFKDDTDPIGVVKVQQSYRKDADQFGQVSNTVDFTKDNACSAIRLPVLCDAKPAYSPYQTLTDATPNIALTGEHFTDETGGYCTCQLETLGEVEIPEGSTSYTKTQTATYYVNPNNTSETCADGTTGPATLNAYTTYDSGQCVYTDPQNSTKTCTIKVGNKSCTISYSETCYVDETNQAQSCDSSVDSFVALDGSVDYYNQIPAAIDWNTYTISQYTTDVPQGSSTGDVKAIATTQDNVQCASNGLEFPVTCNTCGDCTAGAGLNCNLDYDPAFGACTAETTGFCRVQPSSCCNYSSCVYNEADTTDQGTCAPQPLIALDDSDGDDVSDPLEQQLGYDSYDTDSDDDDVLDAQESGTTMGNTLGEVMAATTNPQPNNTGVCPNAQFTVQFNQLITTSDAFPFNNNELTTEEAEAGIDLSTDDIPLEDIDFAKYVYLRPASVGDQDPATVLDGVIMNADQQTLTLELDKLLDFSTNYEIIVKADDAIAAGAKNQTGIVSLADGVAVGCSTDQAALGMCGNGYIKLNFSTLSQSDYQISCAPSYTVLEANSVDFIKNNYTFSKSEQKESFNGTVYAAGLDGKPDQGTTDANGDGVDDGDDDQSIQRVDDGTGSGYDWSYEWDPTYASLTDLEKSSCPVAGILTDGQVGSCACSVTESCVIAVGAASCSTPGGVTCSTDSPNAVCDNLDSQYALTGCSCTVSGSCTMTAGDSACTVSMNEQAVSCTTDSSSGVCDEQDTNWSAGAFVEDQATQIVTADTPDATKETTDTVHLTVAGDGSVEQGWGNPNATSDDLTDSQLVDVEYCADSDYLVTYANSSYNFYWSYCRGSSPQLSSFLPEFEVAFERSNTTVPSIDDIYGAKMDFIYEVAFKDATSLTNDTTSNNNTIAIRVYPNDLDNNSATIEDSVSPGLWYLLSTNNSESSYGETTVDEYQAVTVGSTTYVAISNLNDSTGRTLPYIFVLAYSADANKATQDVVQELVKGLRFNRNDSLSDECAISKAAVIRDIKRVNDLGTMAYLLSSYYYNDSDGNDQSDFPNLMNGSYIAGLSTSLWTSWDTTLGNALGQDLPIDPVNQFYDASNSCPYNPPDIAAGETIGTYYDESGTCWDPVLKDFYGPVGSSVYAYQYHNSSNFGLYANLEYIDLGTEYNPCRSYDDGSAVESSMSEYSNKGCGTFNYLVEDTQTTTNASYAKLF